uniref:Uncharacterized protein n=1 Tax=Caenorhabditis japonica TaxID=281687 RepID=A0A8R1I4Y3_CAEJA
MKTASSSSLISQFLLLSFWFSTTLTASILYRMLLTATFFEFPFLIILGLSAICMGGMQLAKVLLVDFTKSWNISIDAKALPASFLLSLTIFIDLFSFYAESTSSKLLQYLMAPIVSIILLKSPGIQRAKIRRNIPVILSILSTVFTYSAIKVVDFSSSGMQFGVLLLFVNVANIFTLRKYLKQNEVSKFLFSHFSFLTAFLFIIELFQHDIHRLVLYINVWQITYFIPIFIGFVICFTLSLVSFCHVITRFDLSTIAVSLNTISACQFIIVNWLYQNVAMKAFYELGFAVNVSAIFAIFVNISVFWIDVKGRKCF